MSCVLKCPAVRHTADVIDERVTRLLVETFSRVSHNSHSFAPFSKAELTHTNWGFCSGNGPMKGGQELGCVCPSFKYVYEDSQEVGCAVFTLQDQIFIIWIFLYLKKISQCYSVSIQIKGV